MRINTFTLTIFVLAILVSLCDSPPDDVLYGRWRLDRHSYIVTLSYGSMQINKESEYILQLDNTRASSCTTDCNIVSGSFEKDKDVLGFSDIPFTELARDDMIVEGSLASILSSIKSYGIMNGSILVLKNDNAHILIELTR